MTLAIALGCGGSPSRGESADGPGMGSDDATDGSAGTEDDDGAAPDDTRYDVAGGTGDGGPGDDTAGCDKVDFLFVVDDSGSMGDEQQNLVASFPGFISTIRDTIAGQDHHIMVVTTGEGPNPDAVLCNNGVCFGCVPEPFCCWTLCNDLVDLGTVDPLQECGGAACGDWQLPSMCEVTLGGSRATDTTYADCGFVGGRRFMTHEQPDLADAFRCVAQRGWNGDDNERAMEALMNALGPEAGPGACNEGFLRDDAILVVTYITDEEDASSVGDPAAWKQAVVDAKHGNESAVVVLGLVGDPDVPGGVCAPSDGYNGAHPAVRLREFAESFEHGQWASVCEPDYTQFFEQAVGVIDTTCDEYVPPG